MLQLLMSSLLFFSPFLYSKIMAAAKENGRFLLDKQPNPVSTALVKPHAPPL